MDWKRNKKFSFEIFFLLFLDVTHTFVGSNIFFFKTALKMLGIYSTLVKHDIVFTLYRSSVAKFFKLFLNRHSFFCTSRY